MIRKFSCKNFRNVQADNRELDKINILIGPNNSGKSNFIKALSFFANMIIAGNNNNLKSSFLHEVSNNDWDKLINRYAETNAEVSFEWEIDLSGKKLIYRFSFFGGEKQKDFYISKEELENAFITPPHHMPFNYFSCHTGKNNESVFSTASKKGEQNQRLRNIEVSNKDTVVMQFKDKILEIPDLYSDNTLRKITLPILEEVQKYFQGFFSYGSSHFDLSKMRIPSDANEQGVILKTDGSNFANVLNHYSSKDIYLMKNLEEKLKELLPDLETVGILNELGKFVFRMGYDGKQFDLSDMSDGTLKAILLIILFCIPINNCITLLAVDEPELNLHPAWQKIIAKWIQLSGTFRQCFISTHSPDFLDEFTDGFVNGAVGLYVFEKTGNIVKVKLDKIKNELNGWQLGDLYRSSEPLLGGWPW